MEEVVINEQWRSISGYLNYQVSNIGRVRNATSGLIMKLSVDHNGYHCIKLYRNGKQTNLKIHRLVSLEFIPNPHNKPSVDHIDGKAKLNNTITNLRWATSLEQQGNTTKQLNTSSQYKGVSWKKKNRKWAAAITIHGKQTHLGYFNNEEEAALAYNKAAMERFGEFAKPNVIEHNESQL